MAGEKTEKATPKKRKESRKEGQVARTAELGGWISLFLVTLVLPPALRYQADSITGLMTRCLRALEDPSVEVASALLREAGMAAFLTLVVLGSTVLVLSTAITLAQGGLYVASKMMKPDLGKLSLLKGAKRMFGPQAWWELAKMLIKTLLVTGLVYQTVSTLIPMIGGLVPLTAAIEVGSDHAFAMLRNVALAGVAMGALDYLMARRRITKATNMTKQEVKDEFKDSEGKPEVKGRIRQLQREMAERRMMDKVPQADVVITNPTHFAVALKYDPLATGAPVLLAKGADLVAQRIREVASENQIVVLESAPLARAVFYSTELDREIPAGLYLAVAQVLAYVFQLRQFRAGQGKRPGPMPQPPIPDDLKR